MVERGTRCRRCSHGRSRRLTSRSKLEEGAREGAERVRALQMQCKMQYLMLARGDLVGNNKVAWSCSRGGSGCSGCSGCSLSQDLNSQYLGRMDPQRTGWEGLSFGAKDLKRNLVVYSLSHKLTGAEFTARAVVLCSFVPFST
jgi:hypothetical protein